MTLEWTRQLRMPCSVALWLVALVATDAQALPAAQVPLEPARAQVAQDFQWVDLVACRKPPKAAPPMARESYAAYNVQRRYVDIDHDGICEVMDFWIARLGENPSPGMRVVEQASFKYKNAKWEKFVVDLQFYPYAIKSIKTKEVFYIDAPGGSDVGDDMAFGGQEIRIFTPSGWQFSKGSLDQYALAPYEGAPGPLLQALAGLLTDRLENAGELPKKYRVLEDTIVRYRENQKANSRRILNQSVQLTLNIPECRMPAGKVLPDKYYKLPRDQDAFHWVPTAASGDHVIEGNGWERVDGSAMHDWFAFYRIDLNGDGLCDWYLNAAAPMSTGGDRESINTLYLGRAAGWTRIGADVPQDKPDGLGYGKTSAQQRQFLFGEEPAVIHDAASKANYIVAALYSRNGQRSGRPGYRIFDWDADRNILRLLDKWEPGSKAAQVYAYFKAHGARMPAPGATAASDTIQTFDADVEAFELEQACDPQSALRSFAEANGVVSQYLLDRCKR